MISNEIMFGYLVVEHLKFLYILDVIKYQQSWMIKVPLLLLIDDIHKI